LKDMICRGLLLRLERHGHIKLPPRKITPKNPFESRNGSVIVAIDIVPVEGKLRSILPISIRQVRRTEQDKLFDSLVCQYHYLGYTRPVGEHLKYIAFCRNEPIACLTFSSAALHLAGRDRFIGWSPEARKENIHFLAYNHRFLILPWIRVSNLASYLGSHKKINYPHTGSIMTSHFGNLLERLIISSYFSICRFVSLTPFS